MLSDAHCHLDGFPPAQRDAVVERARAAGLAVIVSAGMNLDSSAETVSLAQGYDIVHPTVGIHPWEAIAPEEAVISRLRGLASLPKVVAISEVGLDFARDATTHEVQRQLFAAQARLARERALPLLIHSREAHADMMTILSNEGEGQIEGAIHGFSGDATMLSDWLGLGFYISLGRGLLRPENAALRDLVREIPRDRLLIETDATPGYSVAGEEPEPAAVRAVADRIGQLLGLSADEVGEIATANLRRLLDLEG